MSNAKPEWQLLRFEIGHLGLELYLSFDIWALTFELTQY
jgi:hypothetical protein